MDATVEPKYFPLSVTVDPVAPVSGEKPSMLANIGKTSNGHALLPVSELQDTYTGPDDASSGTVTVKRAADAEVMIAGTPLNVT